MKRLEKIKLRMNNSLFIVCLLFFCLGTAIAADGQSANLTGTWNIDQVTVRKTVNGVVSENTYLMTESFEIFAECPKKITFKAGNKVVFESDGRKPREDEYTVEGNRITRMASIAHYEYEFAITEANNIQLIYSINYFYNHADGRTDKITEYCTFRGHRE